jgi:hypothetical protein
MHSINLVFNYKKRNLTDKSNILETITHNILIIYYYM